MKDKSQKSPKKFNIVDFAIIAIIILLVIAVAWSLLTAGQAAEEEAAMEQEITLYEHSDHMRATVVVYDVPADAAEVMVRNEDPQLNNNYRDLAGYIISAEAVPTTLTITNADGTQSTVTDPETCTVTFIIEGYFDEAASTKAMTYKLGTQELRIGKGYVVKTKSIEATGLVTAMEVVPYE